MTDQDLSKLVHGLYKIKDDIKIDVNSETDFYFELFIIGATYLLKAKGIYIFRGIIESFLHNNAKKFKTVKKQRIRLSL